MKQQLIYDKLIERNPKCE